MFGTNWQSALHNIQCSGDPSAVPTQVDSAPSTAGAETDDEGDSLAKLI